MILVRLDKIFGIDVNTFSAVVTAAGVIVALISGGIAVWALRSAAKASSISLGVDILFRLIDEWGSDAMAKKRAAAAKWRLAKTDVVQTRNAEVDYTNDVLGFFEFVGYLLDENTISLKGVWVNLSDDAVATWYAYKPFIDADQKDDKTLWEDFQKLEAEMEAESERRKVPKSQIVPDDADIAAFLENEAGLDVNAPVISREEAKPSSGNVRIRDAEQPAENEARERVSREAQRQAYKDIFTPAELERFARGDIVPSWELGNISYAFVAELDNEILGVADLTNLRDGWKLVEPMYVHPGVQRSGIGSLLWQRCLEAARFRRAPGVRVWALERNKIANSFYIKQGCKPKHRGQLCVGEHCEPAIGYEFSL